MSFEPNLAADLKGDTTKVRFPVYVSPKLDGIRVLIQDGVALSRSLKPIPNAEVQRWAKVHAPALNGLDGELIVGLPYEVPGEASVMSRTTSGVMKATGSPDFTFFVFDMFDHEDCFEMRKIALAKWFATAVPPRTVLLQQELVTSEKSLLAYEERALLIGYEGIMVRSPRALYKHGRSTLKEGGLSKLKRFVSDEAVITGSYEQMSNQNEATTDALGHTERSTSKAGLVPAGVLGGFYCTTSDGRPFDLGGGFTADQRAAFWKQREALVGQTVTYKHFAYGVKDKPRFPVFVSLRDKIDQS